MNIWIERLNAEKVAAKKRQAIRLIGDRPWLYDAIALLQMISPATSNVYYIRITCFTLHILFIFSFHATIVE